MAIEIVVFPLKMVIFHSYVKLPEANSSFPALKKKTVFFLLNLHCPLFSVKSCDIFADHFSSPELDGS